MYNNWGKASRNNKDITNPVYHLLVYHSLDVAAVGQALLKKDKQLMHNFRRITSLNNETILQHITFYLAIHDVGKFSERFQNLRPDLFRNLRGQRCNKAYNVRHDTMGFSLWDDIWTLIWAENLFQLDKRANEDDWRNVLIPWFLAVTGHHGKPPSYDYPNHLFSKEDLSMIHSFVKDVARLIFDKKRTIDYGDYLDDSFKRFSWLLAGLAVLSDWIASNDEYFPYKSDIISLEKYWNDIAIPKAEFAVKKTGILPSQISNNTGMNGLFPDSNYIPSPLQSHVSICDLAKGPQLFIIEEATGSGKTEAALILAHRLMRTDHAEGIFVALPTMATANAMYERLSNAYRNMFEQEAQPSLVLAHSARKLYTDIFRHSIGLEYSNHDYYDRDEETASAQCSEWLADKRKKALLANVGVGTIDQALMAVLPSKHQSLRLIGLSRNILIVDEVHAYDSYMHTLLCNLLKFHAALGGSAILLSATLPKTQRQELADSFSKGLGGVQNELCNDSYPLVTHVSVNKVSETQIKSCDNTHRVVDVEFFDDISKVEEKLLGIAKSGNCACWIRNTVDDAIEAYKILSAKLGSDKVLLFHARFVMGDRLSIEKDVLDYFGKESDKKKRSGRILVATQVVEQSLDLDFDYMVSDLAPIDLIIQRAGRLHRHRRGERGTPVLGIFAPHQMDNPTKDWYADVFPKGAYVYPNHAQLWLTAHLLSKKEKFKIPDDSRYLIESVFGELVVDTVPEALKNSYESTEGEDMAKRSSARINTLRLEDGYKSTPSHWLDDTKTPTRIGEITTNVRLACWDDKKVIPFFKSESFAWEQSQVSIDQRKIKDALKYDGTLKIELQKAIDTMPDKGKWSVVIPLKKIDQGVWQGEAINYSGDCVKIVYDSTIGLSVVR